MAVAALVVSILAFIAAGACAVYTRTNALAAKGVHTIEQARRLEERRPQLSGEVRVTRTGPPGSPNDGTLRVTLDSAEPLAGLEVTIEPGCGVSFSKQVLGVHPVPKGEPALGGFAYDHDGNPEGVNAHDSMTWAVEIQDSRKGLVRFDAACRGTDGARWAVVIEAPVKASPLQYLR